MVVTTGGDREAGRRRLLLAPRTRDAAKYFTTYRTAPHNKEVPSPHADSSEAEGASLDEPHPCSHVQKP